MPDLPLAPKEIPIEVGEIRGAPLVFYHRPPGHALGTRLVINTIQGQADNEELLEAFESLDEEELAGAALRAATSAELKFRERDVRELITSTFLRAETAEGEPLTVEGKEFDPRKREHYDAIHPMWVTTIVTRLITYLRSLPEDLVGNSNSPAGEWPEDRTSSPTSEAGELEPSSSAT